MRAALRRPRRSTHGRPNRLAIGDRQAVVAGLSQGNPIGLAVDDAQVVIAVVGGRGGQAGGRPRVALRASSAGVALRTLRTVVSVGAVHLAAPCRPAGPADLAGRRDRLAGPADRCRPAGLGNRCRPADRWDRPPCHPGDPAGRYRLAGLVGLAVRPGRPAAPCRLADRYAPVSPCGPCEPSFPSEPVAAGVALWTLVALRAGVALRAAGITLWTGVALRPRVALRAIGAGVTLRALRTVVSVGAGHLANPCRPAGLAGRRDRLAGPADLCRPAGLGNPCRRWDRCRLADPAWPSRPRYRLAGPRLPAPVSPGAGVALRTGATGVALGARIALGPRVGLWTRVTLGLCRPAAPGRPADPLDRGGR